MSELYTGRDELISYLNKRHNKSFCGFLNQYREVIVISAMTFSAIWENLDNFWALNFLKEADNLGFNLNEKVCLFYFTKRVTPRRIRSDLGELLNMSTW